MKRAFEMFSTFLVTIAAAILIWTQVETRWLGPMLRRQPQNVAGLKIEASQVRHVKGTAAIALVEFTDYECPYCTKHARETSPEIQRKLVETGTIRYVLFNYPLPIHFKAQRASEAAECAARQGRYWEMHERLFSGTKAFGDEDLTQSAESLGLDLVAFRKCLAGETASTVMADLAEGRRLGVNSTPTFFIGIVQADGSIQLAKRLSGSKPFDEFKKVVDSVSAMSRRQLVHFRSQ